VEAAVGTSRCNRADTRGTKPSQPPVRADTITHKPELMRGAKEALSRLMVVKMLMLREFVSPKSHGVC
jgi:hypothetical protein